MLNSLDYTAVKNAALSWLTETAPILGFVAGFFFLLVLGGLFLYVLGVSGGAGGSDSTGAPVRDTRVR